MKPIPLFGTAITAISPVITAQRRLNCFWDIRADGDKSDAALIGTPGLVLWSMLPTSPIRGWRVVGSFLYVVSGTVLYKISQLGVITTLGSLNTSTNAKVSMDDNGVQLMIVDGIQGYILTLATNAFAVITDGNFPNGATTVTFINGRFIVNKTGTRQYYVSASYDGLTWTPVLFATKENFSDVLLAVQVFNGLLILWGDTSIEFWQDVGTAPLPYQRVQGATQSVGIAAINSRAVVNNTVVFLGKNPQGTIQVFMLNGYTPQRISTSDVEGVIEEFETFNDAVALSYVIFGHAMYQLTFPHHNRSLLYDATTNLWQEVQTGLALTDRHIAELGITFGIKSYVSDFSSGNIYFINDEVFDDNGTPIKRQVTSRHIRNNGNDLGIDEIFLDMETGVGLQSGQGSDPQIMMESSKDGGRTFGTPRFAPMGKVGEYRSPRPIWRRCGMAKDFVFRFTMTDPVKFVITSGYVVPRTENA